MTTGAGESIDSLRALYNEPIETIAAVREIPGAFANFDEIIAAMPDSIEAQQRSNNPHGPDTNPRLYEPYRQGWYEGYIAWFAVESAIPAGEAGKTLQSSKRVQKTVDNPNASGIRPADRDGASRSGDERTEVWRSDQRSLRVLNLSQHVGGVLERVV